MQKFKHNNTNIWIWKYCLLKIYLDYRELMTTGCWQQRDDSNSNKKITRKFFESLRIFALSNIFSTLETISQNSWNLPKLSLGCRNSALGRSLGVLFIAEALSFKKALCLWCLPRVWRLQEVRFFSSSSILSHGYWVTFLLFTFES